MTGWYMVKNIKHQQIQPEQNDLVNNHLNGTKYVRETTDFLEFN